MKAWQQYRLREVEARIRQHPRQPYVRATPGVYLGPSRIDAYRDGNGYHCYTSRISYRCDKSRQDAEDAAQPLREEYRDDKDTTAKP